MHLLHISDTHGKHREEQNLPSADIIVHSGDISTEGREGEVYDFINWFCNLPYQYKIFIAGNHDLGLHNATIDGLPDNCYYLYNSGVVIEGVSFYGIPLFMTDVSSSNYRTQIRRIPDNTNVLITHQPPYGILDETDGVHYGSRDLLKAVLHIQPKLHLFGHVHNASGIMGDKVTTYSNGALFSESHNLQFEPKVLVF